MCGLAYWTMKCLYEPCTFYYVSDFDSIKFPFSLGWSLRLTWVVTSSYDSKKETHYSIKFLSISKLFARDLNSDKYTPLICQLISFLILIPFTHFLILIQW